MKTALLSVTALSLAVLSSCTQEKQNRTVQITNTLAVERSHETIELTADTLKGLDLSKLGVKDAQTGKLVTSQTVDVDGDGILD